MGKNKGKIRLVAIGLFSMAVFILFLNWHQVETKLTDADLLTFQTVLPTTAAGGFTDFSSEINQIRAVQKKALELSPRWDGIPFGESREPSDLVRLGQGICYDRSRFIEKALQYFGFKVRHVALYERLESGVIASIASPGIASHSVSEVLTSRGWMYVDSNSNWIGLSDSGTPLSVRDIHEQTLLPFVADIRDAPDILKDDFVYVYGLYSRHGRFYPPYDFIPDVVYRDLLSNVFQ